MTRDLELHIDALVLDGLSRVEGVRAGDAFARELVRLLERSSASPLLARSQTIDRLDAAAPLWSSPARSSDLGAAVARAVHRRLVP
jgi:hypothetical protein